MITAADIAWGQTIEVVTLMVVSLGAWVAWLKWGHRD